MKSTCHWYSPVKYVVLGINLFCYQGEDVISLHVKQQHVIKDLFVASLRRSSVRPNISLAGPVMLRWTECI